MKDLKIDLHTHTIFSDGELYPQELILKAKKEGIDVIGICDHDTLEAKYHIENKSIEVVFGAELSLRDGNKDIHLLVYFPEENSELEKVLVKIREIRFDRIRKILDKLKKIGIKIELSEITGDRDVKSFGRPHIAKVLLEKGYVSSIDEAFELYLGKDRPAYVPKFKLTPEEGIKLSLISGGIPIIAHPGVEEIDFDYLDYLKKIGLKGVEIFYPDHDEEKEQYYLEYAIKNNLLVTGGSDFHGYNHAGKNIIGLKTLPYNYFIKLKEFKNEMFNSKQR
ncbi:MAG: PHP domain-containing protein [Candidatus Hydrothermales bacterium]